MHFTRLFLLTVPMALAFSNVDPSTPNNKELREATFDCIYICDTGFCNCCSCEYCNNGVINAECQSDVGGPHND